MDLSYDLREYSDPDECYFDRLNSSETCPIVQPHTIYKDE